MKEHKGPVFSIVIKGDDTECVSASADGSCITWSLAGLQSFTRVNALFAANFFKSALYHPDESQLLTCGTDRKLTYWDVPTCPPSVSSTAPSPPRSIPCTSPTTV